MGVCFLDTETTGITPEHGQVYEVGLITPDEVEHHWWLPVDLATADPIALGIGRFHERHPHGNASRGRPDRDKFDTHWHMAYQRSMFAVEFGRLTHGHHLAGAVVSFDERRLWDLLRAEGVIPSWHYHLIDVEAIAAGAIAAEWSTCQALRTACEIQGCDTHHGDGPTEAQARCALPPWNSNQLSRAVGVEPEDFDRHTALADARWAKAIYEAVMG